MREKCFLSQADLFQLQLKSFVVCRFGGGVGGAQGGGSLWTPAVF